MENFKKNSYKLSIYSIWVTIILSAIFLVFLNTSALISVVLLVVFSLSCRFISDVTSKKWLDIIFVFLMLSAAIFLPQPYFLGGPIPCVPPLDPNTGVLLSSNCTATTEFLRQYHDIIIWMILFMSLLFSLKYSFDFFYKREKVNSEVGILPQVVSQPSTVNDLSTLPQVVSQSSAVVVLPSPEPFKEKSKLDSWRNIAIVSFLFFLLIGAIGQNNKSLAETFSGVFLLFLVAVLIYKINIKTFSSNQEEVVNEGSIFSKLDNWKSVSSGTFLYLLIIGLVGKYSHSIQINLSYLFILFWGVYIIIKIDKKISLYKQKEVTSSVISETPELVQQKASPDDEEISIELSRPIWVKIIAVYNFLIMVFYSIVTQVLLFGFFIGGLFTGDLNIIISVAMGYVLYFFFIGLSIDTLRKAFQKKYEFKNSDKYFMFLPALFSLALYLFFYYQFHFNLFQLFE